VCRFLTPFKLGTSKLHELLPPKIWQEKLRLLSISGQSDIMMEPNGLDIIFHLLSAASFEVKFWSKKSLEQLDEEDMKYTFFNRLANSGVLPNGAQCRLYVCVFRSGCDLTLLA